MKYFRATNLLAAALIAMATSLFANTAHAADSVKVSATLILGSNDGGGVDASLRQYEQNLKKHLRFDTFKRKGGGSATLAVPGSSSINIGSGQNVSVKVDPAGDGKFRISAQWKQGAQTLVNTTVVASKNLPTVLVGPSSGSGRSILLLIAN